LLYEIKSDEQTLDMLSSAEDTKHIVTSVRIDLLLKALNENKLPEDIRYNPLDLVMSQEQMPSVIGTIHTWLRTHI
jgi:hypothetical protein